MGFIVNVRYFLESFGVLGVFKILISKCIRKEIYIVTSLPRSAYPIYLRCGTSDIRVHKQVFGKKEYEFVPASEPSLIVDAGANIGLASLYFASRYPEATILAIEAERSNFELLKLNTQSYTRIVPIHAALWNKNEKLFVQDCGLGKWGFMTEKIDAAESEEMPESNTVDGLTIQKLCNDFKLESIDILKMDIEGAEYEVFEDAENWLPKVGNLIVELHERFKPGCNRRFYIKSAGFDKEWVQGENVFLSREKDN